MNKIQFGMRLKNLNKCSCTWFFKRSEEKSGLSPAGGGVGGGGNFEGTESFNIEDTAGQS